MGLLDLDFNYQLAIALLTLPITTPLLNNWRIGRRYVSNLKFSYPTEGYTLELPENAGSTSVDTNQLTESTSIDAISLNDEGTSAPKKQLVNYELGRGLGTLFSQGSSAALGRMSSNLFKGQSLLEGVKLDATQSLIGAGTGLASNYIGKGITYAMGDSKLGRGVGTGIATGLGSVGGTVLSNLARFGSVAGKADKLFGTMSTAGKAAKIAKKTQEFIKIGNSAEKASELAKDSVVGKTGAINPYGLAMTVAGTAIGSATGPSKEYAGKYGGITRTMDTAYDILAAGSNFLPGGQVFSGVLALNKGLSNVFGSTDGMTVQDAVLGSAFMPAPVKWLNMAGAHTTNSFKNQSWLNTEKVNTFMGNAFGNLGDKFDLARNEAGKTYGTFSKGAYNKAQDNINFANHAWEDVLAMADLNKLQNIRSQYMSSINNLRYAQEIGGAWLPVYRGKQGMKIVNNATNHNIGMRLLSAAALIDNKAMILCNAHD